MEDLNVNGGRSKMLVLVEFSLYKRKKNVSGSVYDSVDAKCRTALSV